MRNMTFLLLTATALCAGNLLATESQAASLTLDPTCGVAPVCDAPCITYKHARCRKKICCGCESPLNVLLSVKDPCCCDRIVEVPVCIPGCCTDVPCVKGRCGLFKRGIVWYEWCCGFKMKVVFDRCGDVKVTYYGS